MIFVDPREGSRELTPLLSRLAPVQEMELHSGDVMYFGHAPDGRSWSVAWEVKKAPDLLQSIDTGRLSGLQAPRMRAEYDLISLMVINPLRRDDDGVVKWALGKDQGGITIWHRPVGRPFTHAEVLGHLNTLKYRVGMPWVNVVSNLHAAEVIAADYHWHNGKTWEEHRSHLVLYEPPEFKEASDAVRVAAQMPGVGMEKARRIGAVFGTPGRVARATREEWVKVEGIGKKLAEKFVEFWK